MNEETLVRVKQEAKALASLITPCTYHERLKISKTPEENKQMHIHQNKITISHSIGQFSTNFPTEV